MLTDYIVGVLDRIGGKRLVEAARIAMQMLIGFGILAWITYLSMTHCVP